jgi:hypothetical protein
MNRRIYPLRVSNPLPDLKNPCQLARPGIPLMKGLIVVVLSSIDLFVIPKQFADDRRVSESDPE